MRTYFASEALFQRERFAEEAHAQAFGIKVPTMLATRFGGSNYAAFRCYVTTNPSPAASLCSNPRSLSTRPVKAALQWLPEGRRST